MFGEEPLNRSPPSISFLTFGAWTLQTHQKPKLEVVGAQTGPSTSNSTSSSSWESLKHNQRDWINID